MINVRLGPCYTAVSSILEEISTALGRDRRGPGRVFYPSNVNLGYKSAGDEKPLIDWTALQTCLISLTPPQTGERAKYSAELPKDLVSV